MPTARSLTWIMTIAGVAFALLHLTATPSGLNWGVNLLAFLPPAMRFGIPILMLLTLVPAVQDAMVGVIQLAVKKISGIPRWVWVILMVDLVLGAIALFWMAREKTFFLGDGRLVMRNLADIHEVEVLAVGFKNAPLPAFIVWKLFLALNVLKIEPGARLAFQFVSIAMGGASIPIVLLLVRRLSQDPVEQTLAALFVLAGAGIQLFFGYVEAYTSSYCALLLFTWLALEYLDDRVHLSLPSAAFGLLILCHFGMVFMAPAMVFLWYRGFTRQGFVGFIVSFAAFVAIVVTGLWVCGYTWEFVGTVFLRESPTHLVPLTGGASGWNAYPLLSPWHFLDLLNLYALLAPFSVVIFFVPAWALAGKHGHGGHQRVFVLLIAMGGMAFSFLMNFDIGMSRDWDLLSPYLLAVVVAAAFVWLRGVDSEVVRRRLMIMMVMITALHTAAYVLVNASEEYSVARFEQLPDSGLWGSSALAYAYEDLSAYFRDRKEAVPARLFTEKELVADSTNARRWVNASVVFQQSGEKEREIHAYEKAIQLGAPFAWVYGNLGSEYISAGRPDDAEILLRKALELDPRLPMAAYNLGSLLGSTKKQHDEALYFLMRAVETDSTFPLAWLNLGTCLYEMGRYAEMSPCYEKFLQLSPADPAAPGIRQLLTATGKKR